MYEYNSNATICAPLPVTTNFHRKPFQPSVIQCHSVPILLGSLCSIKIEATLHFIFQGVEDRASGKL